MKSIANATVAVGLSGGVDSSVAAYLLKKEGYNVVGLFMKNWDDENCPAEADYQDVVQVCQKLDIPFYTINFVEEYMEGVFSHFLDELKAGYTPNPDILCNREIKFKVFLQKAKELGADFLATGHYSKINSNGEKNFLERAADSNKDQTYFLYTLNQTILPQVLFPLADLPKPKIREIAAEQGLITHDKRDSTGICFIGKRKFKDFMERYLAPNPGDFLDAEGETIGKHDGLHFYTIGQRRGLGIGGPGEAWFVADKDIERNTITLVQGEDHPLLLKKSLIATDMSWVADTPPQMPARLTAKIRYRQDDSPCTVTHLENGKIHVEFDAPQRAVTPRQSIVFYDNNICLGGALIL